MSKIEEHQIKANELRIGNWINLGLRDDIKHYGKVLSIGSLEQEFEQVYCECEESFEWAFKDNYRGIPLTEEILEKCCAKKRLFKIDSEIVFYSINSVQFITRKGEIDFKYTDIQGKTLRHIYYLHQLQNLIYALTGKELIIDFK